MDELISQIPSIDQIRSLFNSLRRQGLGDIISNLDLIEWASLHMCLDKKKLDMRKENNPFEILVLSNPLARTILVVAKDYKGNTISENGKIVQKEVTVCAFNTATPIMVDFIQKLYESGIEIETLLDGTYRLNSVG